MKKRHVTIPVFVPEAACTNRCIFCNQHTIAGVAQQPGIAQVREKIESYLSTIPPGTEIEVGFFGGNFTGIDPALQEDYLTVVQPFIQSGQVAAIRISTRPDYIDEQSLSLLAKYQVKTIELGAQSLDDEVLLMANRGHTVEQVRQASNMIKNAGFELGLQMMVGLPGDTPEKSLQTARQIVELGAKNTRIYPTLVIKGTELETLYQQGKYKPLTLAEAISLVAGIAEEFEAAGVKILRMGLHPSPELMSGGNLVAGPFHVAFGEMVQTERWQKRFNYLLNNEIKKNIPASQNIRIRVAVGQKNAATGFAASNRKLLQQRFIKVIFEECVDLQGFEHAVDID